MVYKLEVPLRITENVKNPSKIDILRNGKIVSVDKPVRDFAIIEEKYIPKGYKPIARSRRMILGTNEVKTVVALDMNDPTRRNYLISYFWRNQIPFDYPLYIERLYIYNQDWILSYPNNDVHCMYFDIETDHDKNRMPDPDRDPILSISYQIDDNDIQILYFNGDDKQIIIDFLNIIRNSNIDILVGYNHKYFDVPYIIKRALYHGIKFLDVFTYPSTEITGRKFILCDVYELVQKDQVITTSGIDNLKMKTVAKYFDIESIEIDVNNIKSMISKDGRYLDESSESVKELEEYNKSDVRVTKAIFEIYADRIIRTSSVMKIDLDSFLNGYDSIKGGVILGRILKQSGIVALGNNIDRYGKTGYIESLTDNKLSYRGALVDIYKKGRIDDVYKFDFASQYPSAIVTLNLGSETTRLLKTNPFNGDENSIKVINKGKILTLEISDPIINKNLIVQIDMSETSRIVSFITSLFESRKKYKKLAKEHKNDANKTTYSMYYSLQWSDKVQMNSIYGNMGQGAFKYGDYIVAPIVTAFCRDITSFAIKEIFKDKAISVDTDGVYVQGTFDEKEVNERISQYIFDKYGLNEHKMYLELEGRWDTIYIHEMKNYILSRDGKYSMHGTVFKSSSHSKLYRNFLNDMVDKIMKKQDMTSLIIKYLDLESFPLEYFVQRQNIRNSELYDSKSKKQLSLSTQFEEMTGYPITDKASVEYIVSGEWDEKKYMLYELAHISDVNYTFYAKQIKTLMDSFDIRIENSLMENLSRRMDND